ncbi:phytoene/squalene synthase family protein [Parasphingopyxis marina]|uniref:Phytoene/squalene synthase family protein n=1 Tax=Parasphingopyxis marina TaxID=2761622 RepID=A0A842HV50_9SPHN|nr:phytoene/squalene synthase family protein [Parasphingopyxis marina]MBC2776393.1 phytoene/squalene synthase family protein [Parasphingopyxis marina]
MTAATADRAALVAAARDSIARGSQSFAMASKLFDRRTRERAWLLYAWCRRCDDLADGQALGHDMHGADDPAARLAEIRTKTDAALAGAATGDPAFDGLALVTAECRIPRALIEDHIAGFALDAEGWAPQTETDLLQYCHHVAGVVGMMMALVMGVSPKEEETLQRARDLGLAFQLANIARDIGEDARNGRCYLPRTWLAEKGVDPHNLGDPASRPALVRLARRLAELAQRYEESARRGTAALPFRSAWAVLAAAGIYGDIARKVVARGEAALDERVFTTRREKLGWLFKSWRQALGRSGYAGRG